MIRYKNARAALSPDPIGDALADCYLFLLRKIQQNSQHLLETDELQVFTGVPVVQQCVPDPSDGTPKATGTPENSDQYPPGKLYKQTTDCNE